MMCRYAFFRVFNLLEDITDQELQEHVHSVVGMKPIQVFIARQDNKCQGFAYVGFHTSDEVTQAIEILNGTDFMGKKIVVTI